MKWVKEIDNIWHDSDKEMPRISSDVEFMDKNGTIHQGHIQIDMAGFYCYLKNKYSSFDEMIKWRFIPNRHYLDYKNLKNK